MARDSSDDEQQKRQRQPPPPGLSRKEKKRWRRNHRRSRPRTGKGNAAQAENPSVRAATPPPPPPPPPPAAAANKTKPPTSGMRTKILPANAKVVRVSRCKGSAACKRTVCPTEPSSLPKVDSNLSKMSEEKEFLSLPSCSKGKENEAAGKGTVPLEELCFVRRPTQPRIVVPPRRPPLAEVPGRHNSRALMYDSVNAPRSRSTSRQRAVRQLHKKPRCKPPKRSRPPPSQ